MTSWSVPASVLLAGEYTVTREGGLGVALAVKPRAYGQISRQDNPESIQRFRRALHALDAGKASRIEGLTVRAHIGKSVATDSPLPPLAIPVLREVTTFIRHAGHISQGSSTATVEPVEITLDTSRFFDQSTGKKLGFGSSGAATVLLTAALLHLAGINPLHNRNTLLMVAVRAHRALQGGRGSGYDVACSTMGGVLRFIGGEVPRWERLDLAQRWQEEQIRLYTWQGDIPVSSPRAVDAFDRRFPPGREAATLISHANEAVEAIAKARSWAQLVHAIRYARDLSRTLGQAMGVSAELPPEISTDHRDWVAKASGAGNEQAVLFHKVGESSGATAGGGAGGVSGRLPGGLRKLVPEEDGFRLEQPAEAGGGGDPGGDAGGAPGGNAPR